MSPPVSIAWYIYDGLGSVISEVDDNGNVTATRLYDAFGSVNASTGSSTNKQKFCGSLGHTTEASTGGLVYMRARWYDPAVGRFISEDPAGSGLNWYVYCDNNPTSRTDPTGRSWISHGVTSQAFWDDLIDAYTDGSIETVRDLFEHWQLNEFSFVEGANQGGSVAAEGCVNLEMDEAFEALLNAGIEGISEDASGVGWRAGEDAFKMMIEHALSGNLYDLGSETTAELTGSMGGDF